MQRLIKSITLWLLESELVDVANNNLASYDLMNHCITVQEMVQSFTVIYTVILWQINSVQTVKYVLTVFIYLSLFFFFALKTPCLSKDMLYCRDLHHDSRVLVCSQHHPAVLWPVLSRHKVSQHIIRTTDRTAQRCVAGCSVLNVTVPQVWDRRGVVHRLVFGHACHLWRILPAVRLQCQNTKCKNVCVSEICHICSLHKVESLYSLLTVTCLLYSRSYPYNPSSRGRVLSTPGTSFSAPSNYGRNAYVWDVYKP